MNKSYSFTCFIYSHLKRISLSPLHASRLGIRSYFRQCPNEVLISSSAIHHARGYARVSISRLEEKYKQEDKIPDNFKLIYRSPMYMYAPYGHLMCYGSICSVVLAAGVNYFTTNVWTIDTEFIVFGSLLMALNFSVLHLILQYAMRIYVNDDKYICVMPSLVPLKLSKLMYSSGEVEHVPSRGVLPWRYNRYRIRSKSVIILEHCFRTPADYNAMLSVCKDE